MPILITLRDALARLFPPSNAVTEGPSPKVTVPAALLVLAGAGLLIAGVVTGDADLVGYGLTVLGASGVVAVAGGASGPGSVVVASPIIGTPHDDLLPPEVVERIDADAVASRVVDAPGAGASPRARAHQPIGFARPEARAEDKSVKAPNTTGPVERPPAGSPDVKKAAGK